MPTQSTFLSPRSTAHFANGTQIKAPFDGQAVQWVQGPGGLRSLRLPAEEDTSLQFQQALEEVGVREQETLHLDIAPGRGVSRLRRAKPQEDRIVLRPAPSKANEVQVVLYQDESGGLSWHFPDEFLESVTSAAGEVAGATDRPRLRSQARPTFTIRGRTAAAQDAMRSGAPRASHLRGPLTKIGRKIFKVLVIPILSPLLERPVERIAGAIERRHRQNLIRSLTPESYTQWVETPFTDWAALRGRRSLLVVHGIFSSTAGVLSQLPRAAMEKWHGHYCGRVIAYDHLTVSKSPEENARFFLQQLEQAGGRFELDVLCHSRGGIVSRILAERAGQLVPSARCEVKNVFFVASPNQGSHLGNAEHMLEMIDVFTNLLTHFPDGPVLYSIEVLLALVKLLAYTAERALPGIADMGTQGYIRDVLNRSGVRSPAVYAAAASDFEPLAGVDSAFFAAADSVLDRVFAEAGTAVLNDLVVPTEGVYAANGHPSFPIPDPLVYGKADRIWHTAFFAQPRTLERIERHFGIGERAAVLVRGEPREDERGDYSAESYGTRHSSGRRAALRGPAMREAPDPGPPGPRRSRVRRAATAGPAAPSGPAASFGVSAPAAEPAELQREPAIEFHELVHEGEPQDLVVRLDDVEGGAAEVLRIVLGPGEESVELTVTLSAPGFDVAPDRQQNLTVRRARDPQSERVTFQLTARRPGDKPVARDIRADFWLRHSCIGSVTHRTCVVPKDYQGPANPEGSGTSARLVVPRVPREDCDLIIRVEGRNDPGQPPFRIVLRSEIPGNIYDGLRVGELALPGNEFATLFNKRLEEQFRRYPDDSLSDAEFEPAFAKWQADFIAMLEEFGKHLWTFLPKPFRDEYFRLHRQNALPRSILIHSDETVFPWELVVPFDTIDGGLVVLPPLGAAHVLGRWQPGLRMMPDPQILAVQGFCVLNPTYPPPNDLPWSVEEIRRLRQLFPSITVVSPADLDTVRRQVLDQTGIQILHFSGHGDYDAVSADLNHVLLEGDGALYAYMIAGTQLGSMAHPIVYLNACSAGKAGMTVGRMGGFAANWLAGGCSGIIAPYWPINDDRATEFACALYDKLDRGRAVGEALQELRQEHPGDPNFRAYAYFGDPWTRLSFASV